LDFRENQVGFLTYFHTFRVKKCPFFSILEEFLSVIFGFFREFWETISDFSDNLCYSFQAVLLCFLRLFHLDLLAILLCLFSSSFWMVYFSVQDEKTHHTLILMLSHKGGLLFSAE